MYLLPRASLCSEPLNAQCIAREVPTIFMVLILCEKKLSDSPKPYSQKEIDGGLTPEGVTCKILVHSIKHISIH